jgi:hypothetical protein
MKAFAREDESKISCRVASVQRAPGATEYLMKIGVMPDNLK